MENISIFQALGRKRLEQLDGLRGFRVLAVLITHLIGGVFLARQNICLSIIIF